VIRLVFFCSYPPYDFKSSGERAVHHIITLGAMNTLHGAVPSLQHALIISSNSTLLGFNNEKNARREKIPLLFGWFYFALLYSPLLVAASHLEHEAGGKQEEVPGA
jgi:hypothetical protein